MFKTATRRSAMERWYMRWYIRDDGFLRSCLCSATSTIPLLNRVTRKMTAYRERGDGHNTGGLRIRPGKLGLICTSLLYIQRYSSTLLQGFYRRRFRKFPRLVGRYCSYLLPMQDLATFIENCNKTLRLSG